MATKATWWILDRAPGGVLDTFQGSRAEAYAECDRRNITDDSGSTTVHSGHATRRGCEKEFRRISNPFTAAARTLGRRGGQATARKPLTEAQRAARRANAAKASEALRKKRAKE